MENLRRGAIALLASILVLAGLATPAHATLTYFYNYGYQTFTAPNQPTGLYYSFTIHAPTVAAGDFHSLAGMSVEETIGSRQAVEAGWAVNNAVFGDNNPHFYASGWVNNTHMGWGTNFVDYAPNITHNYGTTLTPGTSIKIGIVRSGGAWWVWAGPVSGGGGNWVGHFLDSNWTNAGVNGFTESAKSQGYGEVAANVAAPCTDMGNGAHGSATTGAVIGSATNVGGPLASITVVEAPNYAGYTQHARSSRTFAYGGPGC